MVERDELRETRERKLGELADLGLPYLPNTFGVARPSDNIVQDYDALNGSSVRVAGRIMRIRSMGKAAFAHIQDSSGLLQLYFKRDALGDDRFAYFNLLDIGDIIGCEGVVFKTRTGEISIQVSEVVLLAKSYLPLPEKWHGLSDVEARYRQRYLDLISNEETRRIFRVRTAVVSGVRAFLDERRFLEVETPILQPLYGGAAANPFTTHYRVLGQDVYLRIATELYLKRLLVGGFERVYELGKDFRNEGFSRKHSPEFTMVELYQAYVDYRGIMLLIEDLCSEVARSVLGTTRVKYGADEIDFSPPWRRITIADALWEYGHVKFSSESSKEEMLACARDHGVQVEESATRGKIVEELVSDLVEPNLTQPTFLHDFPIDFAGSLLAKRKADDSGTVERFEFYIGGMEIGNAFTELNDPSDQRRRMEEAFELHGEAHQEIDRDFLQALEYGMPPAGGLGFGIERLVMILTDAAHIRETILFPLLRAREDSLAES